MHRTPTPCRRQLDVRRFSHSVADCMAGCGHAGFGVVNVVAINPAAAACPCLIPTTPQSSCVLAPYIGLVVYREDIWRASVDASLDGLLAVDVKGDSATLA